MRDIAIHFESYWMMSEKVFQIFISKWHFYRNMFKCLGPANSYDFCNRSICIYFSNDKYKSVCFFSRFYQLILWDYTAIFHRFCMSVCGSCNKDFLNLLEPWILMMVWCNQVLRYKQNNDEHRWFSLVLYFRQNTVDISIYCGTIQHPAQRLRR